MSNESAPEPLVAEFKASMRAVAASVSLVTARASDGSFHGMAVTSATSLSMNPPSMLVAVNKSASIHPVIMETGRFCLNLLSEQQTEMLECFSRSDMRDKRFASQDWIVGPGGQPVLRNALFVHVCSVAAAHDFGTHTVFFGKVEQVLSPAESSEQSPIIWLNGGRVSVSQPNELCAQGA